MVFLVFQILKFFWLFEKIKYEWKKENKERKRKKIEKRSASPQAKPCSVLTVEVGTGLGGPGRGGDDDI